MVDIFDEVDEELRAERAYGLFRRYGRLLIALAVLIIGIAAGWQGWRWRQSRTDYAAATAYLGAMRIADVAGPQQAARRPEALAAFQRVAAETPEGYRTLALLRAAALKADGGDLQGATAVWDQVAGDRSADRLLRDFASLMWAGRQIDTGDPALLQDRLRPLAAPDNPWRALASELQALLSLRLGRTDQAKDTLRHLANDATAPEGVRTRAGGLLERLGG